jgi:hypothetical protein
MKERAEEYGVSCASLLSILRESRFPPATVKQCCRLIVALYIDCEDITPVDLATRTRVWSKVRSQHKLNRWFSFQRQREF